jgi:hypothetical protein
MEGKTSAIKLHFSSRLRAFFHGCIAPSWIGTLGAVAICALLFAFCCVYVTEVRFARSPGRFVQDKDDAFPFVKARALQIATESAAKSKYRVVLIGDSSISEAITSPQDLQRRIEKKVGHKIYLTPLLAGGLNQLEAVDLCAVMRDHLHGEVVLQISPYNMALAPDAATYNKALTSVGIDTSDMADEFTTANLPRPILWPNFFLRNHVFLLSRNAAFTRLLKPLPEPPLHLHAKERDGTEQRFVRDAIHTFDDTKGMRTKTIPNVAMYKRIIEPLQARGIRVALLETPLNPRLSSLNGAENKGIGSSEKKAYRDARLELATETGVPVWDFGKRAKLVSKDFIDYIHLYRQPARIRFTQALANRIAASMPRAKHREAA